LQAPNAYLRATPNTMASRKIVAATRYDKKQEFIRHIKALNQSLAAWFKQQVKLDPAADLARAAQDYVEYANQLEDRYLCKYGEVLTFGSGDCGQLAHGIDEDDDLVVKFPRIVYSLRDKKVCGIACGGLHNACFTEDGAVYTWGCNDDASLGRLGEEHSPGLVEGLEGETIIGVACGDSQTIAVSTKGEVWGWGCYKDKEGKQWFNPDPSSGLNPLKDIKKKQATAIKIAGISNAVEVACGATSCIARCDNGSAYSWGLGECGELGRIVQPLKKGEGEDASYHMESVLGHVVPALMNLEATKKPVTGVKAIGCGAYHTFVVVVGGSVFCCGLNNYSQLGTGDFESHQELTAVVALDGIGVCAVKGGVHHTLDLTREGKIYACGRGDSGQLGVGKSMTDASAGAGALSENWLEPALPATAVVKTIACGGNHNLALTDTHELYSWGYGEMSALGHGVDQDEPTPKRVNLARAKAGSMKIMQV
jgi:regulator of chromosome condensation